MSVKLKCVMLVDDNPHDNFFHERVIRKYDSEIIVIPMQSGKEALHNLRSTEKNEAMHPELILLDINMPGMNGWEFLLEYSGLDEKHKSRAVVVMLTNSDNPNDRAKAKQMNVAYDFKTKPLTKEMLTEILEKYF